MATIMERSGAYTTEELVNLAEALATKMGVMHGTANRDDCVQVFILAAIEAAGRDNGQGIRGYQYAMGRGAILHWLTRHALIRRGVALAVDSVSGAEDMEMGDDGDLVEDGCNEMASKRYPNPLDALVQGERASLVQEAIASLPERERDLLTARYLSDAPETMEAWGARHGLSKGRVSQIETAVMDKLRTMLASCAN